MFVEQSKLKKAKVIRDVTQDNGVTKRETVIEGVAYRLTDKGAYIFDPKGFDCGAPSAGEWFPYSSPNGVRTIVYESE